MVAVPPPPAVAAAEMRREFPLRTWVITAPAGIPVPEISMPATSPVVELTVKSVLPFTVVAAKVCPPATSTAEPKVVAEVPATVAFSEMRTWVSLMISVIVAPAGILLFPCSTRPVERPLVLPSVTTLLLAVVVALSSGLNTLASVKFQVPPPIFMNVAEVGVL